MDFTLSDDQELLRNTARSLFSKECPTSLVRAHADDPSVADGLDKRLREFAGLGDAPLADLCLFLEEAGAALAPGRFFPTTALFAPLLRAIEQLPQTVQADGLELEFTGEVTSAPIVVTFAAYRAFVTVGAEGEDLLELVHHQQQIDVSWLVVQRLKHRQVQCP